ncbi:hypothetical protein QR680_015617 [Steinernema hermaphroditum]|uniref:Uncharacterized protein n=1 Tax=Steinernema hermaphroditum TaxID=289476 RepID=A0AA39HAL5_9BILA|nr:hypothetical protein QR680_015617 [Steinernema hermaphroditum]
MEDGFDDEIQEFLMENELKEQQEYQEKATGPSTEPEPGMVNIEPILTPTSRKIQCDKWEKRTITFGNKFVSLERATGVITPLNRTEFKDLQMKHQDILISKLEAIAFHNLVINNITDLVHPFHLNDLAHQHIQSITSNIVRACKNYIVPPQRCTVIDCEIQQRFCYAEREFMIHTADENLAKQEIYLTPCVIKPKTGKFCILLNNPTNAPVPVFKGMKIAAASVLKNVKGQLMEIGAPLQEQQDKTVDPTFKGGGFRPINMAREQREDVVLAAIIDHLASNKPLQFSEATPESDRNFAVRHIDRFKIGNDNCLYYTFSAIKKTGEHERVAVANSTSDFDELLPYTQWVYNTSISSVTHETPFTLVFGREPIMALDKILNPRSHETFNSEQIEEFRETLFVNLRESWIAAHENAEIDRQKRKEKYDESASETTIKVDQLMSVRGQVHHLDRPAPYTAIACTRGKAVLALTDLTIEAPVVVDIASTTNFVGPAPTLYNYPVLPGETFNLLVYVQRSHPDGGLRRYHGPRTKLASLWMKDCGAFTTNATALELEKTGTVKIRRTIAYVQHVPENTRKSIQIVAPGFRGQLPLKANQIDSGMFNPPPTSGDRVLLTAVEIPHGFKRGRGRSYYLPASLVSGLQESAIRGTEFAPIWLQRDGIEHIKFIDEPRTTEVVSPEEREERLHNYEDNVLAAALFTQNRIQSARRKAGGIASFSPTDEEWRLAFDLKAPTDKDIAEQLSANKSNRRKPTQDEINEKRTEIVTERTKEWNSEGVIQIGTSHHDLRRTQWQTSEVQVSPEGQVTGFASPADPSEVEKEFPEFRTNEGVTEDESVTEGHFSKLNIEVEHPDKKMWIQPSTRHTGMESRINACEGRMISAAHEEETSRGLITRQLMVQNEPHAGCRSALRPTKTCQS